MKQFISFLFFIFLSLQTTAQVDFSNIDFWDGPGHYSDRVVGVDKDTHGNVYVAGHTFGKYTDEDILIIKYDAAGVKIWQQTWNSEENEGDRAVDLYVDSVGNAYIVGITLGGSTLSHYDIVTLKYDANGNLEWEDIFVLPGDNDYASDIKVDQSGNVYVCGYTKNGPGGAHDYVTLKYSSTGALIWDSYYNGPANSQDYARALAVDADGSVYVTGESVNASFNYDITTVKYNSVGVEVWSDLTDGSDNDHDYGKDIIIDANGYIYVTGRIESNGSYELITIKHAPISGSHVWEYNLNNSFYDGANLIRYSSPDNTIVMGGFEEGSFGNYLTVKIDTAGNFIWKNTFSSGNAKDIIADVGIDNLGNVYTSGRSSIPTNNNEYDINIIKYDINGSQLWQETYDNGFNEFEGYISVQDDNDVVMVTSATERFDDQNIHTVRYSGTGNQEWIQRFEGLGFSDDTGAKIVLDSDFNQIIIGNTDGSASGDRDDYVILKMDSLGNLIWQTIYEHPGLGKDITVDVVTDTANNIYVTGYTSDSITDGNYDITTLKLNSEGDILWTHTYALPNKKDEVPCTIALDSEGNIFVAGTTDDNFYEDVVLLKYDTNGNLLGDFIYNNTAENGIDQAYDMVLDTANNVYVVGSTQLDLSINHDYLILKFDNNGNLLWEEVHEASGSKDFANNAMIDGNGDLYVGGTVWNKTSMDLVKYNNAGNQQWVLNVPDADSLADMVIGSSGNIYLTAHQRLSYGTDIKTMKVNPNGSLLWLQNHNNSPGSEDKSFAITLDNSENVFVVGTQEHQYSTNFQAVLLQYDSSGSFITSAIYESPSLWYDKFTDVECLPSGRVLVTGQAYEENDVDINSITWRYNIMAASLVEGEANPRFLRVNPNTDEITIRNFGSQLIDISDYMIASEGNQITQLSSMTVEQGSLLLSSLGEVVLSGLTLDPTGGDLTLYQDASDFSNPADMLDFMQWKNAGNPYETTAVSNGYWASGTFVNEDPAYEYIGNGTQYGVEYWEGFSAAVTTQTEAQCETNCNGSATLTVSGGTPPYTYAWDANAGNQSSATATGLCPGNYTVTVTDAESNQTTYVATIGVNLDLIFAPDIVNESCNGGDGSIILHPSGGTGDYDISWNISGTDTIQSGLIAGSYTATIIDANATSCIWDTTITISTNPAPEINQLTGNVEICAGSCNGTASVSASGAGALTYQWNDPNGSTTAQLNNLCPGTYVVEVADAANCTDIDSITIIDLPLPTVDEIESSDPTCHGSCNGSASISAEGTGSLTYMWSDPSNSTTAQVSGLCGGTYIVEISDANCTISDSVFLDAPQAMVASSSSVDDNGVCDGEATVSVVGGTQPYSYNWNDPNLQNTETASGLCQGTYTVIITDANGCSLTDTVFVEGVNSLKESIQNSFNMYPNPFSDFVTIALNASMETQVQIVDVTGKLVQETFFHDKSYQLDLRGLGKGVYIIRLETNTLKSEVRVVKN